MGWGVAASGIYNYVMYFFYNYKYITCCSETVLIELCLYIVFFLYVIVIIVRYIDKTIMWLVSKCRGF